MDPLRPLRYFIAVAEELHFGRAADRLGIAQPPLSQRIQRLERDLGAKLFERDSRRVELTEAGQILLAEARDLIARWDRAVTLVGKAGRGELDALRAGVPPEMPGRALAGILTAFARDRPGARVELHELTTTEQLRLLAEGGLDTGLLHLPVDVTGLELGPALETPLGVVLPRDSPLAARAEVDPAALSGHGLVLFPRASAPGYYDALLRACWEDGFRPTAVHHARTPEFVLGMVLAGHGVALAEGTVAQKETRVVWRPLTPAPVRRLCFAWPSGNAHPEAKTFAAVALAALTQNTPATNLPGVPPSPATPAFPGALTLPSTPGPPSNAASTNAPAPPRSLAPPGKPAPPTNSAPPGDPAPSSNPSPALPPGAAPSAPASPSAPALLTNPPLPTDAALSTPALPTAPAVPGDPALPHDPASPNDPALPTNPTVPINPALPTNPALPADPAVPGAPALSGDPAAPRPWNVVYGTD